MYLTTPTLNGYVNLLLLVIYNHIQKFNFIPLVYEIFQFKEFCIFGLQVFGTQLKTRFFLDTRFLQNVRRILALLYSKKKKVHPNGSDFCQNTEEPFLRLCFTSGRTNRQINKTKFIRHFC